MTRMAWFFAVVLAVCIFALGALLGPLLAPVRAIEPEPDIPGLDCVFSGGGWLCGPGQPDELDDLPHGDGQTHIYRDSGEYHSTVTIAEPDDASMLAAVPTEPGCYSLIVTSDPAAETYPGGGFDVFPSATWLYFACMPATNDVSTDTDLVAPDQPEPSAPPHPTAAPSQAAPALPDTAMKEN